MPENKSRRELALLAAGGIVGTALVATAGRSALAANQPRMEQAKGLLIQALQQLEHADSDKGGFRVAAIKSIRMAIEQVDAGMHYDDTH